MKTTLLLILFSGCISFAQITITDTDVSNVFSPGNSVTIHSSDITSFNIGSAGGGNNWDFSSLQSTETFDFMCIDPVTSPYINEFPGANYASYAQDTYQGSPAESWSYFSLSSSIFGNMGQAIISSSFPGYLITIENNPVITELQLPTTFNTSWSQSYVTTTYLNGGQLNSSNVSTNNVVDGWGTMTLPGGSSFDALRIRESTTVDGTTIVQYTFLAKNGASVTVEASDSNPPTSGLIDAEWYDWNLSYLTDVEQISDLPLDFSLSQNYPNPFNPSTKIEYSIPEVSFVQLKVYDILGNEVSTLVNEEQSAGTYRADFTAANLASGFYIAQLKAGEYSKTIKMTLLR